MTDEDRDLFRGLRMAREPEEAIEAMAAVRERHFADAAFGELLDEARSWLERERPDVAESILLAAAFSLVPPRIQDYDIRRRNGGSTRVELYVPSYQYEGLAASDATAMCIAAVKAQLYP